jgi:hypothetical protein
MDMRIIAGNVERGANILTVIETLAIVALLS